MLDHFAYHWPGLPTLADDQWIANSAAFRDQLRTRRTCRYFSCAPVPRAMIKVAIEAAGTAPSGANHQPWHFAAIASASIKTAIRAPAEVEESAFYAGKATDEWLAARGSLSRIR